MNSSIAASMIAARRSADFPARLAAGFASASGAEATFGSLVAAARIVVRRLAGWGRVVLLLRFVMPKI
ncbi:hypothetical protein [Bradyrhizobium sp. C9]|uniref:hypothetical protein n=1 Tax=Bradyrhizobium sp. C9 TaxID=142585 RepID=UPI001FE1F285|nr:hypothetical protein [Bradyrhizobium sp. C9]